MHGRLTFVQMVDQRNLLIGCIKFHHRQQQLFLQVHPGALVFIWPINCPDACGEPSLSASAAACVADLAVDAHCLHRRELLLKNQWGNLVMKRLHRDVAIVNLL